MTNPISANPKLLTTMISNPKMAKKYTLRQKAPPDPMDFKIQDILGFSISWTVVFP
jgi:hypothetical protein